MAHASPIDQVQISGLNSKTAAEIVDLIRAEINASGTTASETHSQPQGATHRPTFAASSGQVWTAAGTTIATIITAMALIVGIFQWQLTDFREERRADSQSIRAEIESVREESQADSQSIRAEIGSVRAEIGSVREEIFAVRGEVASLGERLARVETILADRLPTAP